MPYRFGIEHERKQGQNEGKTMTDYDRKHADADAYGNVTAKNQNGIDADGKPIKVKGPTSDKWEFGDSLADVKPIKSK
jgi:hypothetical protein